jgi:hypothetical protein
MTRISITTTYFVRETLCILKRKAMIYMRRKKLLQFSIAVCLSIGLSACAASESSQAEEEIPDEEYEELVWPQEGLSALLPVPSESLGKIYVDTSTKFTAYLSDVSDESYQEYIQSCEEYGFNLDEWTIYGRFRAYDEAGNKVVLSIDYDDSVMRIDVIVPESTIKEQADEAFEQEAMDASSEEFQNMMDEYENFYTEYCNFLRSYTSNESDESDEKYSEYQSKEISCHSQLKELESLDLSDEKAEILTTSLNHIERLLELAEKQ